MMVCLLRSNSQPTHGMLPHPTVHLCLFIPPLFSYHRGNLVHFLVDSMINEQQL